MAEVVGTMVLIVVVVLGIGFVGSLVTGHEEDLLAFQTGGAFESGRRKRIQWWLFWIVVGLIAVGLTYYYHWSVFEAAGITRK